MLDVRQRLVGVAVRVDLRQHRAGVLAAPCLTSQRGLSGIAIIPIASARPGTAARPSIQRHASAGASIAQTTYESRMPTVTASWKSETKVPRIACRRHLRDVHRGTHRGEPDTAADEEPPGDQRRDAVGHDAEQRRGGEDQARGDVGQAAPATVGEHAGDHGCRQGPDGHRADDQPLGGRLDREVLPDVEDRPRDDARIVAKQPAADRRDDRDHRDEGGHFTLGFRRACVVVVGTRSPLTPGPVASPFTPPLVCRVGRCSGQRRLYQIGPLHIETSRRTLRCGRPRTTGHSSMRVWSSADAGGGRGHRVHADRVGDHDRAERVCRRWPGRYHGSCARSQMVRGHVLSGILAGRGSSPPP